MRIWWSVHVVLGDKPKVADEPGPAVQWNMFGNSDPYAWQWWQWRELKRNTTSMLATWSALASCHYMAVQLAAEFALIWAQIEPDCGALGRLLSICEP